MGQLSFQGAVEPGRARAGSVEENASGLPLSSEKGRRPGRIGIRTSHRPVVEAWLPLFLNFLKSASTTLSSAACAACGSAAWACSPAPAAAPAAACCAAFWAAYNLSPRLSLAGMLAFG